MSLLRAFYGIALMLSTTTHIYAWSCPECIGPTVSRRAFMSQAVVVTAFGTQREAAISIEEVATTSGMRTKNIKEEAGDLRGDDHRRIRQVAEPE